MKPSQPAYQETPYLKPAHQSNVIHPMGGTALGHAYNQQDDRSEAPTTVVNGRIVPADAVDQFGNPYATNFGSRNDQFGNPIATNKFGHPLTKVYGS